MLNSLSVHWRISFPSESTPCKKRLNKYLILCESLLLELPDVYLTNRAGNEPSPQCPTGKTLMKWIVAAAVLLCHRSVMWQWQRERTALETGLGHAEMPGNTTMLRRVLGYNLLEKEIHWWKNNLGQCPWVLKNKQVFFLSKQNCGNTHFTLTIFLYVWIFFM